MSVDRQGTIVDRVLDEFLEGLTTADFDAQIADRLRETLRTKGDFSAEAIRAALFSDDVL